MVLICFCVYKTQLMHLSLQQTTTGFVYYDAQATASNNTVYGFQHVTVRIVFLEQKIPAHILIHN